MNIFGRNKALSLIINLLLIVMISFSNFNFFDKSNNTENLQNNFLDERQFDNDELEDDNPQQDDFSRQLFLFDKMEASANNFIRSFSLIFSVSSYCFPTYRGPPAVN